MFPALPLLGNIAQSFLSETIGQIGKNLISNLANAFKGSETDQAHHSQQAQGEISGIIKGLLDGVLSGQNRAA